MLRMERSRWEINTEQIEKRISPLEPARSGGSGIIEELQRMGSSVSLKEDGFYRNLEFGTGGLRGVMGAGTNRMNIYTVAKASQGLADYVKAQGMQKKGIAVSYDSRIKSEVFARTAAQVFAGNGIPVYLYDELMPTPCLSFAVESWVRGRRYDNGFP